MKYIEAKIGPLRLRPFYEPEEIEEICVSELSNFDLLPDEPGPIRIDRFIEKRFGVVPRYEELEEGVLGYTKFGLNGVEDIVVARSLDEEGTNIAERRIRTTLAHEAGHGLLHVNLFDSNENLFLFNDGDFTNSQILCREDSEVPAQGHGYDGRWWEYQANRMIGGLLLPRPLVYDALKPFMLEIGSFGQKQLNQEKKEEAIRKLFQIFEVNPVVVRIRIEEVFPSASSIQLSL